ncbi:hypothetical protein QJS66_08180 [Kocuria rhizophila]|nr:hypothetical protein QJS66_08180 [Kocuria rhizophila]
MDLRIAPSTPSPAATSRHRPRMPRGRPAPLVRRGHPHRQPLGRLPATEGRAAHRRTSSPWRTPAPCTVSPRGWRHGVRADCHAPRADQTRWPAAGRGPAGRTVAVLGTRACPPSDPGFPLVRAAAEAAAGPSGAARPVRRARGARRLRPDGPLHLRGVPPRKTGSARPPVRARAGAPHHGLSPTPHRLAEMLTAVRDALGGTAAPRCAGS